jgi:hypothetical protein
MWRRLARRTFGGAGRPVVFPEQWGLVLATVFAVIGGIAVVAWVLAG